MESLTGTTGKELILPLILPYFEKIGFVYKKTRNKDINLHRKTKSGKDLVYISSHNYSPGIYFYISFQKSIDQIEDISDVFKDSMGIEKLHRYTISMIAWSPDRLGHMIMPYCTNERLVKETADIILDRCERIYLPILDKYDDIFELDNLLNGENMWWDDVGLDRSKIFDMQGFYYKRFIVARLAGRKNIQEVFDYSKATFEDFAKNENWDDEYKIYDNDGWFDKIMEILKDVEPLTPPSYVSSP